MSGKRLSQLQDIFQKEKSKQPSLSFAAFIADSALMELERRQIIRKAPFISLVGAYEDTITLKDVRKNKKFIEVQIRDKKVNCQFCDRTDCIHVGFVLALPEVMKVLSS